MFLLEKKKEEYLKNGCLQILSGRSKYPQLQLKDIFFGGHHIHIYFLFVKKYISKTNIYKLLLF